jgi:S1-C subfamily serine protease
MEIAMFLKLTQQNGKKMLVNMDYVRIVDPNDPNSPSSSSTLVFARDKKGEEIIIHVTEPTDRIYAMLS